MSLGGVSHDACDPPLFHHPIVRPIVPTTLFSPHFDFRHEPVTTVPFVTSIRVPFIPSIKIPFIPSIMIPFIPHPTVPVTPRQTPLKGHEFKKQTGNAYLGSRDGNPTCRGDIPVPDHYDKSTMALQAALQVRQEYEPVSISGVHCAPSVYASRYLPGQPSQGYTRDSPNTELPLSFPVCPLFAYSDGMEHLSANDSATEATEFATAPVSHVATAVLGTSSLEIGQSKERVHDSSGFPEPSYAGVPNTASDQDEGPQMQSTRPSPSVEISADQEWSTGNVASQNSHEAMSPSSPTWEEPVKAAKPKVGHLNPRLSACLPCQIQKRKCDYGYPGQAKNYTKPHSENLPCTPCRQIEEKQRSGNPAALYCFYPKPCEKANNGCGRCGLLPEQQLVDKPRFIWKNVRRKFRTKDQRWWKKHTQPTNRRQDSDLWRNPVTARM